MIITATLPANPLGLPPGSLPAVAAARVFAVDVQPLIRAAALMQGLDPRMIRKAARTTRIVHARWAIMLVLREHFGWSTPRIARALGLMDHTTVMHGTERAKALEASSPAFARLASAVLYAAGLAEAAAA